MESMTTFTSDKESLQEMLNTISDGRYQLPEFQRGWVWDDTHISSLLASVSLSYPIGAVMMLENGNPDVRFKPRPVEGVELILEKDPERFILDGQQRLTSLYQTLHLNRVVKTRDVRKKEILRWYYIDMQKALDPDADREDAILSLPEDKLIKNFRNEVQKDYSTRESEYKNMIFPVAEVFSCYEWRAGYNAYWKYDPEKTRFFDQFEKQIITRFEQYQVPVIKLLKGTPKVAVCQVFEKVNTGGVSLTVFELMTASFAAEGYNLREDWEGKLDERGHKVADGRKDSLHEQRVLRSVGADELLQVISLLVTYDRKQAETDKTKIIPVSCKRTDILKLSLTDFTKYVELATEGFLKAAKFLFQQKIFSNRDLPYTTQIVPLAALLSILGDRAQNDSVRNKLARWYWCGVFGELYGSAVETRFAKDVVDVLAWIDGGGEPSTIMESHFAPGRLDSLRSRNSAAYKGIFALLMRDGCLDFRTGVPVEVQTYFEDGIDIHHIFPKAWCQRNKIAPQQFDSIINKTALSYQTNRIIGGHAPSVYLNTLREKERIEVARQAEILKTHVIDVDALKTDGFQKFIDIRREALLMYIEQATGNKIARQGIEENGEADIEDDAEEN
jgi:hypothetical protein